MDTIRSLLPKISSALVLGDKLEVEELKLEPDAFRAFLAYYYLIQFKIAQPWAVKSAQLVQASAANFFISFSTFHGKFEPQEC